MNLISRREFLKTGAMSAAAFSAAPTISRWSSIFARTSGEPLLRPYPHPLMPAMPLVYATDENHDPFKSAIQLKPEGIMVSEELGNRKFAVNTRWYVDGFGYVWLAADNAGAYYSRDDFSKGRTLNLNKVHFGCETRQYNWAKHEEFTKRCVELFDYATVTHYIWDTWYELFEPHEGVYNWGLKDDIVNWLVENKIRIEGRPLFWFHPSVTPEEVEEKCKRCIDAAAADGGYVLSTGDQCGRDTPPANLFKMVEVAKTYGRY